MLRTRSGPNSASIPCVTPIEPPISAMSSPMMKTSSSARIALARRRGRPRGTVSSGTPAPDASLAKEAVFRHRYLSASSASDRARLGERDRLLDDRPDLLVERLELLVADPEPSAQELDRVSSRATPRSPTFLGRPAGRRCSGRRAGRCGRRGRPGPGRRRRARAPRVAACTASTSWPSTSIDLPYATARRRDR